jgi:PAS domain S-box-containing protein
VRNRPVATRMHLIAIVLAVLCGMLAVTYRVASLQHQSDLIAQRDRVSSELDAIRGRLSRELHTSLSLTQGLFSLVRIQGGITQKYFDSFAAELMSHGRIIRNVALAPDNTVRYVYPLQGNERALGLNYLEVPSQREAVMRAIAERRTVVAGPVDLVQGGIAIIGRTPIFLPDGSAPGQPERYWGIAATVIDLNALLEAAGLRTSQSRLRIALRGKDGLGADGASFWGDAAIFQADPVLMDVPLPSGSWQIAAMPVDGWSAFSPIHSARFLAGFLICLVLTALVFQTLRISQDRGNEVRERKETEVALRQANRALRLFSQINSAVVHATEEQALLTEICRIAVESAGYRMAWVGRAECDEVKTVRPITYAGPGAGFLDRILVTWGEDERGQGTAGTAIRSRKPAIARHLLGNPGFAVWREALETRDFAAAIAVPLIPDNEVYGVLLVYAAEPEAFDTTEVSLLEELGKNISHGMMALRAHKERTEAIVALERARNELEDRVAQRTGDLREKNLELIEEIEQRKRVERTLHWRTEEYRELVENANSIILRMDPAGRITYFNEFAQRFFGYNEHEILAQDAIGTIVPKVESSGRDLARLIRQIAETPDHFSRQENENIRKNGERVWIAWTNKPILDKAGHLVETLCIGNDITELKKTEKELLRAKEAAEAADRMKSAFLATMSHELRTPLNSIIGFTGILMGGLAGPLNEEQQKQLGMVQKSGRHLLALISDVLDISKIEAGELEIVSRPFDLRHSVEKTVDVLRPLAEKKGLRIHLEIDPQIGEWHGDKRRTEQVLMNLLGNAIKFTERGHVEVRCTRHPGHVTLSVRDTGIGISPGGREELFRPFHQLDSGLTRKHEGTGLGLSISKRLLDLMGGSITLESEVGVGSTFSITLPVSGERA